MAAQPVINKKKLKNNRRLRKEFDNEKAIMTSVNMPPTSAILIEGTENENGQRIGTPTKKSEKHIVTPNTLDALTVDLGSVTIKTTRRSLHMAPPAHTESDVSENSLPSLVETSPGSFSSDTESIDSEEALTVVKRQPFGLAFASRIVVHPTVKKIYHIVNKMTGNLGGNGSGGAIYGELTSGSMQKMVNLMKEHTDFSSKSRFIDVGCGLSKPNLHVMQDPGVEISYGIEMEEVRWLLGMHNLNQVMKAANTTAPEIKHKCFLAHGNITSAKTFDPFTHVYMFDIGFPPTLFLQLAKMFNRSKSNYLICYHGPRLMVERYGFNVELLHQSTTSMHGSSENHMGYLYKRIKMTKEDNNAGVLKCDPLFQKALDCTREGLKGVSAYVRDTVEEKMDNTISRRTRSSTRRQKKQ